MATQLFVPKFRVDECLAEIRKDPTLRGTSVFMLTTSNEERDKLMAYDLNVAGYIIKPVVFESFVAAVSKLNAYWELCERP